MAYDWSGSSSDDSLDVGDLGGDDYGYTTDFDVDTSTLGGDYDFGQDFDTSNWGEDITLSDPELGTDGTGYTGQDFGGATNIYDDFDINKDFTAEIPNPANPGQTGYGWKYYENGTAISPTGEYYKDGQLVYNPKTNEGMLSKLGSASVDFLKKSFTDDKGNTDWKKVIGAGAGMLSAAKSMGWLGGSDKNKSTQPRGYQGKIPTYQAVRSPVEGAFAPTKAGDPNRQYFSDTVYATPDKAAAAKTATQQQAQGIATLQQAADTKRAADELAAQQAAALAQKQAVAPAPVDFQKNLDTAVASAQKLGLNALTKPLAAGGLAGLKEGTYLRGNTDGMADKLRTEIEGGQPAALSHGEFVIPADVVSHLGNGNSDAGAKRLYAMMDKVRQARTGTKKQGKEINPDKYMLA